MKSFEFGRSTHDGKDCPTKLLVQVKRDDEHAQSRNANEDWDGDEETLDKVE
jgi:hypothetical protein